ncbi:MAG TPA: hypothetical protein VKB86_01905 [Pyrinomonadaceae bacterium]|nr:hypothetical protein [Pyrinomonadaceae bacterium]
MNQTGMISTRFRQPPLLALASAMPEKSKAEGGGMKDESEVLSLSLSSFILQSSALLFPHRQSVGLGFS